MSRNKYDSAYVEVLNYFRRGLASRRIVETLCESPGFQRHHPNPILIDRVLNIHRGSLAKSRDRDQHLRTEKYFKHHGWASRAISAATAASVFVPGSNFAFAALHSRSAKRSISHIGNLNNVRNSHREDRQFGNYIDAILRVKTAKFAGRSGKASFNTFALQVGPVLSVAANAAEARVFRKERLNISLASAYLHWLAYEECVYSQSGDRSITKLVGDLTGYRRQAEALVQETTAWLVLRNQLLLT